MAAYSTSKAGFPEAWLNEYTRAMLAFRLASQRLIPIETASDSPDELTRRLPRGLYTTFSTNSGGTRVLGLAAHLTRLYPSADSTPAPSASPSDLRLALSQLAADNAPGESRFRVLVGDSDGTVYVVVQKFAPPAREVYERGVRVVTADLVRHDARRKDSSFIEESQSLRKRIGGDIYEALLTKNGRIYEGMTSNFYAVLAGRSEAILVTARTGVLLGVTRRVVLRLARGEGMQVVYRAPRLDEDFAEAFITSSSRGIVPIVQVDGRAVGQGRVGAWTKRLSLAYAAYVEERSENFR
ncbi:MAG: D-alanine aminotransferase [Anaerolineales bacterium]|nr:D-alanine aminotransferase [Anaerolineales bacterium]